MFWFAGFQMGHLFLSELPVVDVKDKKNSILGRVLAISDVKEFFLNVRNRKLVNKYAETVLCFFHIKNNCNPVS